METELRVAVFAAVFGAMALWEVAQPRQPTALGRGARWPHNLGLLILDAAVLRIVAPGAAIAVALTAQEGGWGLVRSLALPEWAAIAVSIVLLDLAIYVQHVMFHAVPTLWRVHRVHHADLEL